MYNLISYLTENTPDKTNWSKPYAEIHFCSESHFVWRAKGFSVLKVVAHVVPSVLQRVNLKSSYPTQPVPKLKFLTEL
jgi:hypothetical protein